VVSDTGWTSDHEMSDHEISADMTAGGHHPEVDYQQLFDAAPSSYLVLDADLVIVAVNQAYLAATATDRKALLGRPIFQAFPDNPDDPTADGVRNLRRSLETVLATGRADTMALQRYDIQVDRDKAGGHYVQRYWSPVNTPVLGADGRLTHIIHRVEDVTEFVWRHGVDRNQQRAAAELQMQVDRMEADLFVHARELQDVNRQLRDAYAELAGADQKLHEQQQAKDRFIATLSHELRNPLAAVLAATEILALDAGGHSALAVLRRQVNALVQMTDDLLNASRALTGRLEVVRRPLDLRTTVETIVQDRWPEYLRTDRTLRVSLPVRPVPVDGDAVRLCQMLDNLLSNARKYTRPSGTVQVELAVANGHAVLTVRDDGIGFDPAAADQLFDVFARAVPSGMTDAGGLGLGLAIVRGIVELHGGTVSAHSAGPATGAEFRVELPLAGSLDPGPAHPGPAPRSSATALRMLIIEDNVDLAATYQTLLERRGHHVTVAHTGNEGLAAARRRHFDLVLCDLGLPDITGYEVARHLRRDPDAQSARLIAHSGYSQDADRQQSLQAGFDAHLTKPMTISDLEHVLDQPRPMAPFDSN
jgi:signal transduction histidine kinase/ActR/RegA family two-component response regulator